VRGVRVRAVNEVDVVVTAREESIGAFSVRRSLPSVRRRMVGPFTFLDHTGPTSARMNVLPPDDDREFVPLPPDLRTKPRPEPMS